MLESPPPQDPAVATTRLLPIGVEVVSPSSVHVRVWAPAHAGIAVRMDGSNWPLRAEAGGYFAAEVPGHSGSRYGFLLGNDTKVYPDPVSRSQPDGPHGLSEVIDPSLPWHDDHWAGVTRDRFCTRCTSATFTPEGTLRGGRGAPRPIWRRSA